MKWLLSFFVVAGLASVWACSGGGSSSSAPPIAVTEEMRAEQPARLRIIDTLRKEGAIYKIEQPGQYPHIWVTPTFRNLPFDSKQSFADAILTYYYIENQSIDMIVFKDHRTGERIGSMTIAAGFSMD